MKKSELLKAIDELLELDSGTLKGNEELSEITSWDSLAILGFIAFIDQNFGIVLKPSAIIKSKTVNDLISLIQDKISVD